MKEEPSDPSVNKYTSGRKDQKNTQGPPHYKKKEGGPGNKKNRETVTGQVQSGEPVMKSWVLA